MGEGEVGHVQVVLDLAAKAGLENHRLGDRVGPAGVLELGDVGKGGELIRVEPDPDHPVALPDRVGEEAGLLLLVGQRLDQRRDVRAGAGAVERPAVVGAAQLAVAHAAPVQLHAFVGAAVLRGQKAVRESRDHQLLAQKAVGAQVVLPDVARQGYRLPRAAEHLEGDVLGELRDRHAERL